MLYLQRLESEGLLYTTPSQDYDDSYQIEYARRHGGIIVTNDLFRQGSQCGIVGVIMHCELPWFIYR